MAPKDKKGLIADEGGFTLNTQMVRSGSQAIDHAFDFRTRTAEIEWQAEPQSARFEIIGALHPTPGQAPRGHVGAVRIVDGFLVRPAARPRQDGPRNTHRLPGWCRAPSRTLLHNREAGSTCFDCPSVLMNLFTQPAPRVLSTVTRSRSYVSEDHSARCICVHLRESSCICV